MPRIIKPLLFVLIVVSLSACTTKHLKIEGQAIENNALITQKINIKQGGSHWLWVCYTELSVHKITGYSCQNDTAMPLFSGGMVDGEFEFEYISKLLLKISPERMLEYIKISIYQPGTLTESKQNKRFIITRNSHETQVVDSRTKLTVTLTTL